MAHNLDKRASLAAAATTVIVGFSAIATEIALSELGPAALAMLRYGIALALLVPAAVTIRRGMAPGDVVAVALLGVGQFGLLVFLFNLSLAYIPAARAIVLFSTTPLLAMALQVARGADRFSTIRILAVTTCVFGVAICLSGNLNAETPKESWIGDLSALGSAVVGAICGVGFGPYMRRCGTTNVTMVAMSAAVVALVFATLVEGMPDVTSLSLLPGTMVLALGLGSAAAFWLWVWALGRGDTSLVISFLAAAPIITAVLQVVLIGQPLEMNVVMGGLLVSAGLFILGRNPVSATESALQ